MTRVTTANAGRPTDAGGTADATAATAGRPTDAAGTADATAANAGRPTDAGRTAVATAATAAGTTLATATVPTPPGPFTIVAREHVDGRAAVIASGWAPDAASLLAILGDRRLALDPHAAREALVGDPATGRAARRSRPGAAAGNTPRSSRHAQLDATQLIRRDDLGPITRAVREYVDGDLRAIDAIAVEQAGGPFITRAWSQLRAIPAGAPQTYMQLAASSGNPAAVRAAGSACGRNTAALFVPCHRVLRTGGALGGFLYGLDVKRWLLAHEAAAAGATAAARSSDLL